MLLLPLAALLICLGPALGALYWALDVEPSYGDKVGLMGRSRTEVVITEEEEKANEKVGEQVINNVKR